MTPADKTALNEAVARKLGWDQRGVWWLAPGQPGQSERMRMSRRHAPDFTTDLEAIEAMKRWLRGREIEFRLTHCERGTGEWIVRATAWAHPGGHPAPVEVAPTEGEALARLVLAIGGGE